MFLILPIREGLMALVRCGVTVGNITISKQVEMAVIGAPYTHLTNFTCQLTFSRVSVGPVFNSRWGSFFYGET